MITRDDVLSQAADQCMKELYSLAQPEVTWDEFIEQNKEYNKKYKEWESLKDKSPIKDFVGPKPYEFYYLPRKVMKEVCDNYVHAYEIDSHQELLNIIRILKNYCKDPIVDKYIDDWTDENGLHHPGYRSYDHPDNLEKEIFSILKENSNYWKSAIGESNPKDLASEIQNKFFEFLDMAGNFFDWNRNLNAFNMTVYLGASPNSNKQAVIDNWKQYRDKEIEIDETKYEEEYDDD